MQKQNWTILLAVTTCVWLRLTTCPRILGRNCGSTSPTFSFCTCITGYGWLYLRVYTVNCQLSTRIIIIIRIIGSTVLNYLHRHKRRGNEKLLIFCPRHGYHILSNLFKNSVLEWDNFFSAKNVFMLEKMLKHPLVKSTNF